MMSRICRDTYRRLCLSVLTLSACGCAPKSGRPVTFMQPELLYLKDAPCASLYVEVDTMEGVQVSQEWLDELKAFLTQHCSKPEGITLVRDEPVPVSQIEGLPIALASVLCTNGPSTEGNRQPAYLHVFFYDSSKLPHQKSIRPHTTGQYPCAIQCDVDCAFKSFKDRVAGFILRHEAGHVLGLCKRANNVHCRNHGCLMRPSPDLLSQVGLMARVTTLKNDLCPTCKRDLQFFQTQPDPNDLSFAGPFLLRREDGYCVASLPQCEVLILGPPEAFDWRKSLARTQAGLRQAASKADIAKHRPSRGVLIGHDIVRPAGMQPGSEPYRAVLARIAAEDPWPHVRRLARGRLQAIGTAKAPPKEVP